MTRETRTLAGVVVTAEAGRPSRRRWTRRPSPSPTTSVNPAVQCCRRCPRCPGVTVGQDGKVQVRGSDKVVVLIDGKQTALTGFGSQNGLDNLPASALERIEIINNPSARFDANASAGIINLVLKKQEQEGFNGKLGMMGGAGALWEKKENLPTIRRQYQGTPKFNPSLSVNYRKGATNTFLQGDWLYSPTLNKNEFSTRTYDDGTVIIQQVKRNRRTDYATLNAGVDHAFDDHNTAERLRAVQPGEDPRQRRQSVLRRHAAESLPALAVPRGRSEVHRVRHRGLHAQVPATGAHARIHGELLVPSRGREVLLHEHAADIRRHRRLQAAVRRARRGPQRRLHQAAQAGARRGSASRAAIARFRSTCSSSPAINSPLDTGAGGWATYRETIPALYGNYVFESQRIELEGGVRFERVRVDYDVNPDHNTYKSDGYRYFQPFPNLRAAWKFDESNKLSLFFNRRVDRPNEVDIRIFPKYDEPELIKVGNPALQPQYATSAELGYKTQLVDGKPLRRRVSPHCRRHHHAHRHAGAGQRAALQRLPERRTQLEHRVRTRLAADRVTASCH